MARQVREHGMDARMNSQTNARIGVTLRLVLLGGLVMGASAAVPARAGDFSCNDTVYWCTRDAIYERLNLIAWLEANPDIDEAAKGPAITAARAEIHRLHATLPPPGWVSPAPCCYARKPLHIR
jgi:hypothetical protein